jgi:hypothetical protein
MNNFLQKTIRLLESKNFSRVILTLVFLSISYILFNNRNQLYLINEIYIKFSSILILLASVLSATFALAFAWTFLPKKSQKVSLVKTLRLYFITNLSRYIPGGIIYVAHRQALSKELGLEQKEMLKLTAREIINAFVIGTLVFLIIKLQQIYTSSLVLVLSFIIMMLIYYFYKDFLKQYLVPSLLYFLYILLSSLTIYVLNMSLYQSKIDITLILMNYALAWAIAIVVPGLPGGIGAREIIFALLFFDQVNHINLILLILLHRLLTLFVEIGLFILARTIK